VFFVSAESKEVAGEVRVSADSKRLEVAGFSEICEWLVTADLKGFIGAICILLGILAGTADSKGVRRTARRASMVLGAPKVVPNQHHDYSI
jgi:hypothetical protein